MAEIWECRCRYRLLNSSPEQCAENTHTFLFPGAITSLEGMRDAMAQAWAPIVHLMHIDVMWEGIILKRMEPRTTGLIHLRFDEPIPGQVGGVVMPTSTAVEVLRDTGVYGRANRGRWWIPWITNSMMDEIPHNEIHEDAAASILGALDSFTFIIQGHNVAGILAIPIVYSRRAEGGGTHWNQVSRYRVVRNLRSLAQRGRRNEACPPFPNDHLYKGGMSLQTSMRQWGSLKSIARLTSQWKFKALSLGNGLGNEEPPDGWNQPGFDASSWTDYAQVYTPSPPVLEPGYFDTTPCVPGPNFREGITYPDFWNAPPDLSSYHNPTDPGFQLPWWVWKPDEEPNVRRIPRDGHILLRTEIDPGIDRRFLTCAIEFCAIDSICMWVNGELILEQTDGEWVYPEFPEWQDLGLPMDPDRRRQTIAILVRSNHTPPMSVSPCNDPDQEWSWRQWHIYGDCNPYDFLCLPSIFAFWYDEFQRASAFIGCRFRAEWIDVAEGTDPFDTPALAAPVT